MTKFQKSSKEKIDWKTVPLPARCVGCPYPKVGLICHGKDGSCLRTDMQELEARKLKKRK